MVKMSKKSTKFEIPNIELNIAENISYEKVS